ncbi:MAG: Hsp70 family protein, partial [Candidatus Micrarchaeota archaeon]|nr:Hsp70 family protein [Candidatus Micrarchaeota archaeon]
KKEAAETLNEAEMLVYSTEKTMKEYGDKISADTNKEIEAKLATLKDALPKHDAAVVKPALDALKEVIGKIGEEIYKKTGGDGSGGPGGASGAPGSSAGPGAGGSGPSGGDQPIDAQFTKK